MFRSLIVPLLVLAVPLIGCKTRDGGDPPAPSPEPSPTAPALCQPTAGGPYWALEGETITFTPVCATGATAAFTLDPLPDGASFDGTTFTWATDLEDASTWTLAVLVPETAERADVTIGIADAFDAPGNAPPAEPETYLAEYGLPVLFLSPAPASEDWRPTSITYGGRTWAAEAKKRGVTSLAYPKNSYKLRFPKEDKFDDVRFGFENERRLCITTTFDDNSYLRNRLAFEMWSLLDPEHVKIRQTSVVVHLDGKYWGLYTMTDCVDDELMQDNGLAEEGNVFKAFHHAANFDRVAYYEGTAMVAKWGARQGFEKIEGLPLHGESGAYTDLEELVEFVTFSDDATFGREIAERIDVRDYADWWIFATFLRAEDSAAKNSFHYHHHGLWRYVPWDFNASFGQGYTTTRRPPQDPVDFFHRNLLFRRLNADPSSRALIRDRYRSALTAPWKKETLLALVDTYAAQIRESALRDEKKWGPAFRTFPKWSSRTDFTSHEDEVAYLRYWIDERWDFWAGEHGL